MAWNVREDCITLKALNDFTNMQWRIIELATSEPNAADYAAGGRGHGILFNEPRQYEAATVVVTGECRVRAGKAIAIGDRITAAASGANGSGWATNATSGGLSGKILGVARSACASGSLFTMEFVKVEL
jgi:hypothetical protein